MRGVHHGSLERVPWAWKPSITKALRQEQEYQGAVPLAVLLQTPWERLEEAQTVTPLKEVEEGEAFGGGRLWGDCIRELGCCCSRERSSKFPLAVVNWTRELVSKLVGMQAAFMPVDPSLCSDACECSLGVPLYVWGQVSEWACMYPLCQCASLCNCVYLLVMYYKCLSLFVHGNASVSLACVYMCWDVCVCVYILREVWACV